MSNERPTTDELLRRLHHAKSAVIHALHDYSVEQMTQLRDHAGWTIKDHLDHLAVWEEGIAALLEKQPRYEAMGVDRATVLSASEDELNAIMRERVASSTLDGTLAALRASHEHLRHTVENLSDDDLMRGYSYFQPNDPGEDSGKPIVAWIVGNSNEHYLEHLPWIQAIAAQPQSVQ